jgi:hypothetical protein
LLQTQSLVAGARFWQSHELKILKDSKDCRTSGLAGMKNCGAIAIRPMRINDISEGLDVIVMNGKLSLGENESEDWGARQSQPF